jgi:hypothetical protein
LPPNREDDPNELSCQLTDGRAGLLSAAAQRPNHCLVVPQTLKPGVAQKVAAKLLTSGLVREINAKSGMEIWRRDKKIGQAYSLKLTAAGLKAIAAEERVRETRTRRECPAERERRIVQTEYRSKHGDGLRRNSRGDMASAPPRHEDRARGRVAARDQGVRLDELIAATGWLPHTARAR